MNVVETLFSRIADAGAGHEVLILGSILASCIVGLWIISMLIRRENRRISQGSMRRSR